MPDIQAPIADPPEGALAPDPAFGRPADSATLHRVAAALKARGIEAEVLPDGAAARARAHELIPDGAHVYNATSRTLETIGLAQDIVAQGRYDAARTLLDTLDPATQISEYRRGVASPQVVVGSVHAVTEDGQLVIASASGSQLSAYSFGAAQVIWVVGAQKVVPDLATAFERIKRYSYPLEDARARAAYGMASAINKQLVISGDMPGRARVLLVEEVLGF
ncbi:MAG: hypothetical protein QOJ68_2032 [Blastococcus sp.]|jgi:hypothetical protein|nr:hypothetical protein [Blastococcus sp.]